MILGYKKARMFEIDAIERENVKVELWWVNTIERENTII
jgi:hypothetical protein